MIRITQASKWRDNWFLGLSVEDKLVFIFLTDNCDEAGFYELNIRIMAEMLGVKDDKTKSKEDKIKRSLNNIKKAFITNKLDDKVKVVTKIWIKKFLFHQEKLPLDLNNTDSKKAYWLINENLSIFDNHPELTKIISDIPAVAKRINKIFTPPSYEEFREFFYTLGDVTENDITEQFNYWLSCGWIVGKKKMVDWKAAVRNAYARKNKNSNVKHFNQSEKHTTRLQQIEQDLQETFDKLNATE